jgi:hypothetical protein
VPSWSTRFIGNLWFVQHAVFLEKLHCAMHLDGDAVASHFDCNDFI